jgi:GAF domain-containing protein
VLVAGAVSVASMAAFSFFFLPPRHSVDPGTSVHWEVLGALLVSSLVVSELAARSQREARRSERLADEQAALRRVATLVARGVPPPEVFAAVAREVGLVLGVEWTHMARYELDGTSIGVAGWSPAGDAIPVGTRVDHDGESVGGLVLRTGRPARMHDYEHASGDAAALGRERGLRSAVGAPIVVDQRLWGVMMAASKGDRPLPPDAESRIAAFTELVATAISNTEARTQVGRLADEQAALRRVATLVAQGVPPTELFAAVTEEVGGLLGADLAGMIRYETDATVTPVAAWAAVGEHPELPDRWPTEDGDPTTMIAETRRPARVDDWTGVPGPISAFVRDVGINSSVGSPILVEGRLWGALAVHTKQPQPLPADTESRLENFTELVATAMSNAQARAEVQRLADEQAALRRVATLVARESSTAAVLAAVAEELSRLLRIDETAVLRYEDDETVTVVANSNEADPPVPVGGRRRLEGDNLAGRVQRASTTTRDLTGWSRRMRVNGAFAPAPALRSSSKENSGASSSPSRAILGWRPARRTASGSSPSWSPRRSRTLRRGASSRRPAPGSSLRPTTSAGASSAISTMEPSSVSSTRSSP